MTERLIERFLLPNGLTLELFDTSRIIAGDRWLVSLLARIEIDVKQEYFTSSDTTPIPFDALKNALGERVVYENRKNTRHFIDDAMKRQTLSQLKEGFLRNTQNYLSASDFPRKLLIRKFQQSQTYTPHWFKI